MSAAQKSPREKRFRKRLPVDFGEGNDLAHSGFTTNVSPRGIGITTSGAVPRGASITLKVRIGEEIATLRGKVIWARMGNRTLNIAGSLGVRIESPSEAWYAMLADVARNLDTLDAHPGKTIPPPHPPDHGVPGFGAAPSAHRTAPPPRAPAAPKAPPAPLKKASEIRGVSVETGSPANSRTPPPRGSPSRTPTAPPLSRTPGAPPPPHASGTTRPPPTLEELRLRAPTNRNGRVAIKLHVRFGPTEDFGLTGVTQDVSKTGIALESLSMRTVGTTLHAELTLPDGRVAFCRGKVVRAARFSLMQAQPNAMGIRWDSTDHALDRFIASLPGAE